MRGEYNGFKITLSCRNVLPCSCPQVLSGVSVHFLKMSEAEAKKKEQTKKAGVYRQWFRNVVFFF